MDGGAMIGGAMGDKERQRKIDMLELERIKIKDRVELLTYEKKRLEAEMADIDRLIHRLRGGTC